MLVFSPCLLSARGQPVVVGNRLFAGSQANKLYSLDAKAGCVYWVFDTVAPIRGGVIAGPLGNASAVFFGDAAANAYAGCCTFRGSVVAWTPPRASRSGKTYTVAEVPKPTTKTRSGIQRWGPSGAGIWSTPTIDEKRDAIYVATGDNYSDPPSGTSDAVLALERATGKMLWSRQITAGDAYTVDCDQAVKTNCPDSNGPDADFGQPPILVSLPNKNGR